MIRFALPSGLVLALSSGVEQASAQSFTKLQGKTKGAAGSVGLFGKP